MTEKVLATFRIEASDWESFKNAAMAEGSNASEIMKEFVRWYLAGNRLESPTVITPTNLDNSVPERLDSLEQRLDKVANISLDETITRCIDERIAASLDEVRSQFEAQLEELRGKLKAR